MNINSSKNGIWIIGDVHGEYDKLVRLIKKLPKDIQICFSGDLVDRGSDSAKVLDTVIENNWLSVLGNHEIMMIHSMHKQETYDMWLQCGGKETLSSYENDEIYLSHYTWLKELPYFYHFEIEGCKPLVVSHSYIHHLWINKDHRYGLRDGQDILWRHMFDKNLFDKDRERENDIFNIFGHSHIKEPIITDSYAMIDTGATYNQYETLTAIHYPSLEVIQTK